MKFDKKRVAWIIVIFLAYMTLNIIISEFYITARYVPLYLQTINWTELVTSAILSIIIGVLVSVNTVLLFKKVRQRSVKKEGVLTCTGTAIGLSTGVCTACSSLIPLIFGLGGVSFGWGSLPLRGIEVQIATVIILGTSLYFIARKEK